MRGFELVHECACDTHVSTSSCAEPWAQQLCWIVWPCVWLVVFTVFVSGLVDDHVESSCDVGHTHFLLLNNRLVHADGSTL